MVIGGINRMKSANATSSSIFQISYPRRVENRLGGQFAGSVVMYGRVAKSIGERSLSAGDIFTANEVGSEPLVISL